MNDEEILIRNKILENAVNFLSNPDNNSALKKDNLKIEKLSSGLTNHLYVVSLSNDEKYFLKIFGTISKLNLVDRNFENLLIQFNSKLGLCPSLIKSNEFYRIEEYLNNVYKPEDDHLYDENFLMQVIHVVTEFELSSMKFERDILRNLIEDKTIFCFLEKIINLSKNKFKLISELAMNWSPDIYEKLIKVKNFVDNFTEIFGNLTKEIKSLPLILNHCDVHKHNLLINKSSNKLMLIDYEYACFNFVGFDFVNYFVESIFDLEYPSFPFYKKKIDNVSILFEDELYYKMYLEYINVLERKINIIVEDTLQDEYIKSSLAKYDFNILRNKNYFFTILAVSSLFWFYAALISIEFEKIMDESHFDFLGYSIDRLSIYEAAIKILNKN